MATFVGAHKSTVRPQPLRQESSVTMVDVFPVPKRRQGDRVVNK